MARLPIPGQDKGTWGDVLNDYLAQSLNADGTLKSGIVTATKLDSASQANLTKASTSVQIGGDLTGNPSTPAVSKIQGTGISTSVPTTGQVLKFDGTSWAPGTVTSTTVSDASSSTKGILQLAGDLSGSASAPTVPGLANKLDTSVATSTYAPKASPTFTGTVTVPAPTNGTDATTKTYVDATVAAGTPDATSGTKGKLALTGDLGGSATTPLVAKINGVTVPASAPTNGQVLTATSGTAASWSTLPTAPVTSVAGRTGAIVIAEADVTNLTTDLAAKATDTAVVHLAGAETVSGAKTFSGTTIVPTPTAGTHAATKAYVDSTVSAGAPDASTTVKGLVQLTNDLGGTATAPTVPGLANKAAKGANSDITSLTGLTTALSVAQGGTGSTTQNFVDLSTTQSVAGAKTFSGSVTVPTPTAGGHATTKTYVDGLTAGSATLILNPTAVKTGAYTAIAQDLVLTNASTAAFTVTLPTTPADSTLVEVKKLDSSVNAITVACGGSDTFAIGGTSLALIVPGHAVTFRYQTSGTRWIALSNDVPVQSLAMGVSKTVATTYTISTMDHVILADATSAAFTVTLPTAVGFFGIFTVSGIATNNNVVTVATTSSQTISGASTVTVGTQGSGASYSSVDLISDGSNWRIV